jgi:glycolate oxidase
LALTYAKLSDKIITELIDIVGAEHVSTLSHELALKTGSCAPFPMHDWAKHMPDVAVMPGTTDEVVRVIQLANRHRIPVVPRAAATGLADGCLPLRKGILLDIKRMREILEIDEQDMTVTVQPGVNMQELNRVIGNLGFWFPDDPASYGVAVIGGRIGTGGWSLIGAAGGHIPDLVLSMEVVLPTGKVIRVGEGGGRKIRKSSVGYRLKELFMGHQGTLGVITEATLDMFPRPEAEFPAFFGYDGFEDAWKNMYQFNRSGLKTLGTAIAFDEEKLDFLRRDDEAYIPLPESIRSVIATCLYGTTAEVEGASKRILEIGRRGGGKYLGRELSEGDWASRHDRYHIAVHGRDKDGQVLPVSWHCEDSAINYSKIPYVRKRWHEIVRKYINKYDGVFDDFGMFIYTNPPFRPWGDFLTEVDVFMAEYKFTDAIWRDWVRMKREISEVTLEVGGSISACHGGVREGDVELVPRELKDGQFELMKQIKKMLDPNNIMNPGKYLLDQAYEGAN